jgi:hypothetical protein
MLKGSNSIFYQDSFGGAAKQIPFGGAAKQIPLLSLRYPSSPFCEKNVATCDLMAWDGGWLVSVSSTKNTFSIYFDHFNTVF